MVLKSVTNQTSHSVRHHCGHRVHTQLLSKTTLQYAHASNMFRRGCFVWTKHGSDFGVKCGCYKDSVKWYNMPSTSTVIWVPEDEKGSIGDSKRRTVGISDLELVDVLVWNMCSNLEALD
jgi:hypothetical protein